MYSFAQFWEYTNQRIRYDENIQYLAELSASIDLKSNPPQQCALPKTPTFRPQISRQIESRNVLRRYASPAKLRLSKTKQRDYMESVSKWAHKKYKKWTTKREYEDDEEWNDSDDDSSTYNSGEWETDSDYEQMNEFDLQQNALSHKSLPSPIEQQYGILHPSLSTTKTSSTPLLIHGVVSEAMRGPKHAKINRNGKRLRKKITEKTVTWKGDEDKRLKVCISALMQMRFHDQLAYSGTEHSKSS